jgi:hypothetical protein
MARLIKWFLLGFIYTADLAIIDPAHADTFSFPPAAAAPTISFANPGYMIISSLYIEWGCTSGVAQSLANQTITFPIAFPTNLYSVVTTGFQAAGGGGGDIGYVDVISSSTSQFKTQYTMNRCWLAVGN